MGCCHGAIATFYGKRHLQHSTRHTTLQRECSAAAWSGSTATATSQLVMGIHASNDNRVRYEHDTDKRNIKSMHEFDIDSRQIIFFSESTMSKTKTITYGRMPGWWRAKRVRWVLPNVRYFETFDTICNTNCSTYQLRSQRDLPYSTYTVLIVQYCSTAHDLLHHYYTSKHKTEYDTYCI